MRAFSTLAAPILRGTISLVEHEGARVFVRSGDPTPCRRIPLDKFNQITHNMPFVILVVCVGLPLECGGYKRHHMPTLRMHLQRAQEANHIDGKCSRHCASSRIFGPGTVVAESDVYRCMQRANDFRVKYDISCRCALNRILRNTMSGRVQRDGKSTRRHTVRKRVGSF